MINKATKLFDYLQDESKEYVSEFVFGTDTDTLDMQGEILEQNDKEVFLEDFEEAIPKFLGEIMQRPPKVSAISIGGQKAYALQRKDIAFEVPEKTGEPSIALI